MSENLINTQIDGTVIQAAHVNQYKTALVEDVLPRNLSGQNEDEAGSLGSDIYRWFKGVISSVFTNKLSVGAVGDEANNPFISQTTNNLNFKAITGKAFNFYINNILSYFHSESTHDFYVAGVLKSRINADGIDGTYIKSLTVGTGSIAASAVTSTKIADLNVSTDKIAALAVTTAKIADDAITGIKISNNVIEPTKLKARVSTTSDIDVEDTNYYSEASTLNPSGTSFLNGVSVTITMSKAGALAWYCFSTNSNHRCGIASQPDSAIQEGGESGVVISAATETTTITARVYNVDGASQSGTVTLRVFPLS